MPSRPIFKSIRNNAKFAFWPTTITPAQLRGPAARPWPDPQDHEGGGGNGTARAPLISPPPYLLSQADPQLPPQDNRRDACLQRASRDAPLQRKASLLPAKVTEHRLPPLPPPGMLGKDASPSKGVESRQAPLPRSAPYRCGGRERPRYPGFNLQPPARHAPQHSSPAASPRPLNRSRSLRSPYRAHIAVQTRAQSHSPFLAPYSRPREGNALGAPGMGLKRVFV